jgi:hypothetical protein
MTRRSPGVVTVFSEPSIEENRDDNDKFQYSHCLRRSSNSLLPNIRLKHSINSPGATEYITVVAAVSQVSVFATQYCNKFSDSSLLLPFLIISQNIVLSDLQNSNSETRASEYKFQVNSNDINFIVFIVEFWQLLDS